MGWATGHIQRLQAGEVVKFRPRGHSMTGKISSGQLCTVEPIEDVSMLRKGDVVLCQLNGHQYLHLIGAIKGERFQIANNRGHVNGWVGSNRLYGRLTKVED